MQYNKKSESELEVVETPVVVPQTMTYDLDTLKYNELHILEEINKFVESKKKELEDIRVLIAKCEELNIRSKQEIAVEIQAEKVAEEQAKVKDLEVIVDGEPIKSLDDSLRL